VGAFESCFLWRVILSWRKLEPKDPRRKLGDDKILKPGLILKPAFFKLFLWILMFFLVLIDSQGQWGWDGRFYWGKKKTTDLFIKLAPFHLILKLKRKKCFRPTRAFDGPSSCKKLIIVTMALGETAEQKGLLKQSEHVGEASLCPDPFSDPPFLTPREGIFSFMFRWKPISPKESSPRSY